MSTSLQTGFELATITDHKLWLLDARVIHGPDRTPDGRVVDGSEVIRQMFTQMQYIQNWSLYMDRFTR